MKIVDSDAFMDMSQTAQLLYFHLSMRADDDGFIGNPKKIMRMIGSSEDDMKILLAKRFLLPFESGIVVIKHWKVHNYIQNDRYTPTQYIEEKSLISIKENGAYTDRIQDASTLDTQVRLEIGKDRLGKSKGSTAEASADDTEDSSQKKAKYSEEDMKMVDLLISLIVKNTPEWVLNGNKETWAEHIEKLHRIDGRTYEQIEYMIRWTQADPFWRQNILSTAKLREKFNDLIPKLKASVTKNISDQQKASKPKMI